MACQEGGNDIAERMGETLFPRSTKHFTSQSEVFDTPFWASTYNAALWRYGDQQIQLPLLPSKLKPMRDVVFMV